MCWKLGKKLYTLAHVYGCLQSESSTQLKSCCYYDCNIFFKQTSEAIFNAPIPWLKSLDGIACVPECIDAHQPNLLGRQAK